ncbi:MAG: tyrosine-type recombinase/integrase [Acholeplasmatales bacterium]|nr:tyrosine-type recombinase/integrase [Acholeplasmatales bacterium]
MRTGRPKKYYNGIDHQKSQLSKDVVNAVRMSGLSDEQLLILQNSLEEALKGYNVEREVHSNDGNKTYYEINSEAQAAFLQSKRVEGKSKNTIYNYGRELDKLFALIPKDYRDISSSDIKEYLDYRKSKDGVTNVTISNIRMYLMSFFKWAMVEERIYKNPMDKIGAIKRDKKVIQTLTDEESEIIRCACDNERDLAIIDLLAGSGMRVSELTRLNIEDVNFDNNTVKVYGKGAKERICFLTGKAKVHIRWYINSRTDNNPALFVTAKYPFSRLTKNGVEYILKTTAKKTGISHLRLHPHKYRSTLATNMMNKGADISTVQHILGHESPDTTSNYYVNMSSSTLHNEHNKYVT